MPLTVRVKDPHNEPIARISFLKEGRAAKGEASPSPICNLNLALPKDVSPEHTYNDEDIMAIQVELRLISFFFKYYDNIDYLIKKTLEV